ncbi:MAG TPA: hypothetical protein VF832_06635 [Longimicrobiales bacterium]
MPDSEPLKNRRDFLRDAALLAAGSVALPASLTDGPAADAPRQEAPIQRPDVLIAQLPELPTRVFVQHEAPELIAATAQGRRFSTAKAEVTLVGSTVRVACPREALSRVVLRWEVRLPADALYLGDAWERGYGDLQWRYLQPERVLPWYFAAHHAASGRTFMAGVMTQPAALCFWTVDAAGISLWLDLRNGGSASLPGEREIAVATLLSFASHEGERPMAALRRFCAALSPHPRLPAAPVAGNNNWYYAYGRNFDADAMRRDAAFLAQLADGHRVRPFCVIDAGWTPGSTAPGGPWTAGDPKRFPDMPALAADMLRLGVRPGIWVRPTALSIVDDARRLRPGPAPDQEKPLDLTLPENLAGIHADIERLRSWGFELIKHDFSTFDVFGRWGFEMGAELTEGGWHFADRSLTNAEIILRLYRTLRQAAGEATLLGCNTVGHLGAGLFEVQRTGDDTSGRRWERTRRMGVNTLAYRLPQHRTFFISDADCAAHTERTPWELDRQYLDLVARSGTALFVSADPRTVTPEQRQAFHAAMQTALSGGSPGDCEPLDWLSTTSPRAWRFGNKTRTYRWEEAPGAYPFRV